MSANVASPLLALTRPKKGPRGQPKGTITTSPKEVDEISRGSYGKIYKGNVEDKGGLVDKYTEEYDQFIYKA